MCHLARLLKKLLTALLLSLCSGLKVVAGRITNCWLTIESVQLTEIGLVAPFTAYSLKSGRVSEKLVLSLFWIGTEPNRIETEPN